MKAKSDPELSWKSDIISMTFIGLLLYFIEYNYVSMNLTMKNNDPGNRQIKSATLLKLVAWHKQRT